MPKNSWIAFLDFSKSLIFGTDNNDLFPPLKSVGAAIGFMPIFSNNLMALGMCDDEVTSINGLLPIIDLANTASS
jgi:hypothetical protein